MADRPAQGLIDRTALLAAMRISDLDNPCFHEARELIEQFPPARRAEDGTIGGGNIREWSGPEPCPRCQQTVPHHWADCAAFMLAGRPPARRAPGAEDGLDAVNGLTVDALEEAIHTVERPTKVRVMCMACRPKAEKLHAALAARLLELANA